MVSSRKISQSPRVARYVASPARDRPRTPPDSKPGRRSERRVAHPPDSSGYCNQHASGPGGAGLRRRKAHQRFRLAHLDVWLRTFVGLRVHRTGERVRPQVPQPWVFTLVRGIFEQPDTASIRARCLNRNRPRGGHLRHRPAGRGLGGACAEGRSRANLEPTTGAD